MAIKAYVLLKASSGTEKESCKRIIELEPVLEASIIFGEYDILAKVSIATLSELEDFLTTSIRAIPTIILTSTMVIAREYKGKKNRSSSPK